MEQYQYSFSELTDMHLVYGELHSNVLVAERPLQRRHEGPGNLRTTRTPELHVRWALHKVACSENSMSNNYIHLH